MADSVVDSREEQPKERYHAVDEGTRLALVIVVPEEYVVLLLQEQILFGKMNLAIKLGQGEKSQYSLVEM